MHLPRCVARERVGEHHGVRQFVTGQIDGAVRDDVIFG